MQRAAGGDSPLLTRPAYAPGLNPAEGIWSLPKRAIAPQPRHLVRIKRKLKKIKYRHHLSNGCLAKTGLTIEHW
jgi:hypothetical protein